MPNVTAYLSDDLAEQVKAHELSLSALLQGAARKEIARLDELAAARDGMVLQEVETGAGGVPTEPVLLRFTGKLLASDPETDVYLADSGTVLVVYENEEMGFDQFGSTEEFVAWVHASDRNNLGGKTEATLAVAATELGARRVINL